MKRRFKYNKILLIALIILIICLFYSYLVVEVSFKPITGSLSKNSLSFEIYKENITFGETPLNYQINRKTEVDNNFDFPVKIYFYPSGKISKLIEIKPNQLYLEPQETKEIEIYFVNDGKSTLGDYKGNLLVLTRKQVFGI